MRATMLYYKHVSQFYISSALDKVIWLIRMWYVCISPPLIYDLDWRRECEGEGESEGEKEWERNDGSECILK